MLESFEKIPVKIYKNPTEGSNALAAQIATLIKEKQAQNITPPSNEHWIKDLIGFILIVIFLTTMKQP